MKPSGDGRHQDTAVQPTNQLRPKRSFFFTTQQCLWRKRLLRALSKESSAVVVNAGNELTCDHELRLRNLSIELCNLITETRIPAFTEQGFRVGPHCSPVFGLNNHQCNPSVEECQQHQIYLQRLLRGKSYPSFDIDVLLLPECCQSEQDYKLRDKILNKEYLLLERWCMEWKIQGSEKTEMDVGQLLRAVRSFLHFSQLSAWLSSCQGTSPSHIYYWVKVPGELFVTKFDNNPGIHIFPKVQVSENVSATVKVSFKPRIQYVPIIPCSKHKGINQNISHDALKASSSQCDTVKIGANCLLQHNIETDISVASNCSINVSNKLARTWVISPVNAKNIDTLAHKDQSSCNAVVHDIHKENQIHSLSKMPKSEEKELIVRAAAKSLLGKDLSSHDGHNFKRKRHRSKSKNLYSKKNKMRKLSNDSVSRNSSDEPHLFTEAESLNLLCNEKGQSESCSKETIESVINKKRKIDSVNKNSERIFSSQKKYKEVQSNAASLMPCVNKIQSFHDQSKHLEDGNKIHYSEKLNVALTKRVPECLSPKKILKLTVLRDVKNTPKSVFCPVEQLSQAECEVTRLNDDQKISGVEPQISHKTGDLPLPSSPVPQRRSMKPFNYVAEGAKRNLFRRFETGVNNGSLKPPSKFFKGRRFLGNFEESILNGCLQPVRSVEGFKIEIGASGSFCPNHLTLPVEVQFYELNFHKGASPYLGQASLGNCEYHVPKKGAVQVTLFNPSGTVIKVFFVNYDLANMPSACHTFIRQRIFYMPVGANVGEPSKEWLRYIIHLRFATSKVGKLFLHGDVKILVMNNSDVDAASIHSDNQYELRSFTEAPINPSFSSKSEQHD